MAFSDFKSKYINISSIHLDTDNPRIVTINELSNESEIIEYLFKYEDLAGFIKKIAGEGKNPGAEKPFVIKGARGYIVIEGNRRIASYKILSGKALPPKEYSGMIQRLPQEFRSEFEKIECIIAPSRDDLLPIMAGAHFGLGDKSKWGYLGSRKAVYKEWESGRGIKQIATIFNCNTSQIKSFIIDYKLYQAALGLHWTDEERQRLLSPSVEFNPPIRFLQTSGHKEKVGIKIDGRNLGIVFSEQDSLDKYRHLISRLVIYPSKNLGATASYDAVFKDYMPVPASAVSQSILGPGAVTTADSPVVISNITRGQRDGAGNSSVQPVSSPTAANHGGVRNISKPASTSSASTVLFSYSSNSGNFLIAQLMKEANTINVGKFPASATALLRCIMEAILKEIVDKAGANPDNKLLSLEVSLDICLGQKVVLPQDDKNILKEFKRSHLNYVNMGVHATVIPTRERTESVRGCVDQFVMRQVC